MNKARILIIALIITSITCGITAIILTNLDNTKTYSFSVPPYTQATHIKTDTDNQATYHQLPYTITGTGKTGTTITITIWYYQNVTSITGQSSTMLNIGTQSYKITIK